MFIQYFAFFFTDVAVDLKAFKFSKNREVYNY